MGRCFLMSIILISKTGDYWQFYRKSLACAFQSFPLFFEYEINTQGEIVEGANPTLSSPTKIPRK